MRERETDGTGHCDGAPVGLHDRAGIRRHRDLDGGNGFATAIARGKRGDHRNHFSVAHDRFHGTQHRPRADRPAAGGERGPELPWRRWRGEPGGQAVAGGGAQPPPSPHGCETPGPMPPSMRKLATRRPGGENWSTDKRRVFMSHVPGRRKKHAAWAYIFAFCGTWPHDFRIQGGIAWGRGELGGPGSRQIELLRHVVGVEPGGGVFDNPHAIVVVLLGERVSVRVVGARPTIVGGAVCWSSTSLPASSYARVCR